VKKLNRGRVDKKKKSWGTEKHEGRLKEKDQRAKKGFRGNPLKRRGRGGRNEEWEGELGSSEATVKDICAKRR